MLLVVTILLKFSIQAKLSVKLHQHLSTCCTDVCILDMKKQLAGRLRFEQAVHFSEHHMHLNHHTSPLAAAQVLAAVQAIYHGFSSSLYCHRHYRMLITLFSRALACSARDLPERMGPLTRMAPASGAQEAANMISLTLLKLSFHAAQILPQICSSSGIV